MGHLITVSGRSYRNEPFGGVVSFEIISKPSGTPSGYCRPRSASGSAQERVRPAVSSVWRTPLCSSASIGINLQLNWDDPEPSGDFVLNRECLYHFRSDFVIQPGDTGKPE